MAVHALRLGLPVAGLLLVLLLLLAESSLAAAPRTALVIGNADYRQIAPLLNPVNDARDMAAALRELDFDVMHAENVDQREMERSIREFGDRLRVVGGDALFYFAGHGVEHAGRNFLIPLRAGIEGPEDLRYKAIDAGQLLAQLESARNGVNIVILDACRNNPFRSSRGIGVQGLASMSGPTGSLIAFATAPGSVAADGRGRNGIFTKHLLRAMSVPGARLEETFASVRRAVAEETGRAQIPWSNSSVIGEFSFNPVREAGSGSGSVAERSDREPSSLVGSGGRSESGGTTASPGRLRVDGDGVLHDRQTSRSWLCSKDRRVFDHTEALRFARRQSRSGGSAWRLPDEREFEELVASGAAALLPGLDETGVSRYWLAERRVWFGTGRIARVTERGVEFEKSALSGNAKACLVRDSGQDAP